MTTTNDHSALTTPLGAGRSRVVLWMDQDAACSLGRQHNARHDRTLAEAEGPWGLLRISLDGFPVSARAQVDGRLVATMTATGEAFEDNGPVGTFPDRDVPLALGEHHGGVRLTAEGSRLRPAGRRRYLRATIGEQTWTYGATQTITATRNPLGKVLGSVNASIELRRGPDPATGDLVTSNVGNSSFDEKEPHGRTYLKLSWVDGATVGEIVLTALLATGTNPTRLMPLWWRTAMAIEA